MKKIWFMMLMMCAVSAFTACSDDEENEVINPVTGVSVPATGKIGNEVIIRGTGFTASGIAIYLENASKDRFKMEASFNNAGASFTVPYTLSVGPHSVLLTQNEEEWPLGTITLEEADNPIGALTLPEPVAPGKETLIGGNGYDKGDKIVLQQGDAALVEIPDVTVTDQGLQFTVPKDCAEGVYAMSLVRGASSWSLGDLTVQKLRRVKKIMSKVTYFGDVTLNLSYDKEGRLSSIVSEDSTMKWDLEYGNDVIKTTSVMAGIPLEYTLENGRVVKSVAFDAWDDTETYNYWTYDGDYLKSVVNEGKEYGGANLNVTYKDGNLSALEECQCTYEYGENALNAVPNTIDPGYVLQLLVLLMGDEDTAIALLCNATGKTSVKVPTQISKVTDFTEEGGEIYTPYSIDSKREGEVLKMVTEGYEAEITYEVID